LKLKKNDQIKSIKKFKRRRKKSMKRETKMNLSGGRIYLVPSDALMLEV